MTEIIIGPDGRKFCILNKIPNNFKTQDQFTAWEQNVRSNGIFIFIHEKEILVVYEITNAEFSMISNEEK